MTQQNLSPQFLRRVRKGIFITLELRFGQANRTASLASGELNNNDRSQSDHQRLYLLVKNNLYHDSKES